MSNGTPKESLEQRYAKNLAEERMSSTLIKRIVPAAKAELTEPSSTGFGLAEIWAFIGDTFGELIEKIVLIVATIAGVGIGGFVLWIITSILEFIIFDIR